METLGTGAGQVNLLFKIASVRYIDILFANTNISTWTFSFILKKNKGDRLNIFTLSLVSGISFVHYTDSIRLSFTAAQTSIEEGDYVWQLVRTDLNVPLLNGKATFSYDAPQ